MTFSKGNTHAGKEGCGGRTRATAHMHSPSHEGFPPGPGRERKSSEQTPGHKSLLRLGVEIGGKRAWNKKRNKTEYFLFLLATSHGLGGVEREKLKKKKSRAVNGEDQVPMLSPDWNGNVESSVVCGSCRRHQMTGT